MKVKLYVFNLSVTLQTNDYGLQTHIKNFLQEFYTVRGLAVGKNDPGERIYAGKIKGQGIYQLHYRQFAHLYHYLKDRGIELDYSDREDFSDYTVTETDFNVRKNWVLREAQVPAYEFLINKPVKSKLIPLQPGAGKTLIALMSVATLKKRLGVVVLSRFTEKWISDIATIHDASTKDVMLISGSRNLAGIIEMAKRNEVIHNYFVFSAETIQAYLTAYEYDPENCIEQYGCAPMELFPLLGVGIMLNDESHMSFHLIYRIILYLNVKYQIGLTGTLISDDATVRRVHKVVYPDSVTYSEGELEKYTDVYPITYTIHPDMMRYVKTTNYGSTHYSHTAFEASIFKKPFLLSKYTNLIKTISDDYYIQHYQENDKLIVFVAMVDTATHLTQKFKEWYPEKHVVRYCEKDNYDDMLKGDIIVSTPTSLSTGIDIPNARVAIQTVSISSTPTNLQSFGRLRKLKDRDTKFCYLYCENIPKHREYNTKRLEIFSDRAKSIQRRRSRVGLA